MKNIGTRFPSPPSGGQSYPYFYIQRNSLILVEKIFDENQFVISIGTYGWNGIITLLGIDNKSEIVRKGESTIKIAKFIEKSAMK